MRQSIELSVLERAELVRRAARPRAGLEGRRARLILLLASGASWDQVMRQLRCSRGFVARWSARFRQGRMAALRARHGGQRPLRLTPRIEALIVRAASQRRPDGRPRWTTRSLAQRLDLSHMTVHRVWQRLGN